MKNIKLASMKTSLPRRSRRLALHVPLLIAVLLAASKTVTAYPTGSMSCSDIGDFAAAVVVGKHNGRSMEEELDTVNKRTGGYPIERKNLTEIVRAIYTEPWAAHLSEDGARSAFTADCEAQAGNDGTAATSSPSENVNPSASQSAVPTLSAAERNTTDDVSLSGDPSSLSSTPSANGEESKRFYVRRNEEFRLGDYSYIITNVRVGTALGSDFLRREKASNGSTYLFVNYFIRNDWNWGKEVAKRPTDDMWIMDSNGRKYLPDKRATAAISPEFAPQQLRTGVSHKAFTIFEVPLSVAKSNFAIIVGEIGVTGTDRKLAKLAGSLSWPTPSPTPASAKSKSKQVARRSHNSEQEELWRRMDRPLGTPWRGFSAPDQHGYPNN